MVDNSTNINKIDNRLSLSPQTIAHNKDHIFEIEENAKLCILLGGHIENCGNFTKLFTCQVELAI
jgi:hypothetical protein